MRKAKETNVKKREKEEEEEEKPAQAKKRRNTTSEPAWSKFPIVSVHSYKRTVYRLLH